MCGFIVDKAIAEMLNKMTVVVCDSHSDESAKDPRGASPEEINHALANAAPRAERYYFND